MLRLWHAVFVFFSNLACNSEERLLNFSYWILKADTQIAKMNIYFTSSQDQNKFEHP